MQYLNLVFGFLVLSLFPLHAGAQTILAEGSSPSMAEVYPGSPIPETDEPPAGLRAVAESVSAGLPAAIDPRHLVSDMIANQWHYESRCFQGYTQEARADCILRYRANRASVLFKMDGIIDTRYAAYYRVYSFMHAISQALVTNGELFIAAYIWARPYFVAAFHLMPEELKAEYRNMANEAVDYVVYLARGGLEEERQYLAREPYAFARYDNFPAEVQLYSEQSREYLSPYRPMKAFLFRRVNNGQLSLSQLLSIVSGVASALANTPTQTSQSQ